MHPPKVFTAIEIISQRKLINLLWWNKENKELKRMNQIDWSELFSTEGQYGKRIKLKTLKNRIDFICLFENSQIFMCIQH